MMKEIKEEWRPVRGFEEYAEINNLGLIHYYGTGRGRYPYERWTYGSENNNGYLQAKIGGVNKGVHQWVYLTFIGDIPDGLEVNHMDEDKHNNCVWNLNILTSKENKDWGTGNARRAASNRGQKRTEETRKKLSAKLRGKPKSPEHKTKLSAAQSKAVQALDKVTGEVVMEFPSAAEAGKHGFSQSAVSACCRNCYSTHKGNIYKGLIWRYSEK